MRTGLLHLKVKCRVIDYILQSQYANKSQSFIGNMLGSGIHAKNLVQLQLAIVK